MMKFSVFAATLGIVLLGAALPAQSTPLPAVPAGVLLALHFHPQESVSDSDLTTFATRSPEVAGVVHYVIGGGSSLPNAFMPLADPEGLLRERFAPEGSAIVVVDAAGKPVARFTSAKVSFNEFAQRMAQATYTHGLEHYNVPKDRLAIQGYDTVSYFNGAPAVGSPQILSMWNGVTYRFANAENRARFAADPLKFAPAYGGWCATAMADGKKVTVNPTNYKITDGRLFLFYKGIWGDAINDWNKQEQSLTVRADNAWQKTSGEEAKH